MVSRFEVMRIKDRVFMFCRCAVNGVVLSSADN